MITAEKRQELLSHGFTEADIAQYEAEEQAKLASKASAEGPVAPGTDTGAPSVPFDPSTIPTTTMPEASGSASQNVTEALGAANAFLGSPVGHVVEVAAGVPIAKSIAKSIGEGMRGGPVAPEAPPPTPPAQTASRAAGDLMRNPMPQTRPPVGPVAPTGTPNYAPPGTPSNVTQIRPGAAPTPIVKESIGMRNMPMPEPNAINGGNTYLQRMAVLAESVAPTLGRIGGATTAILMPGNIGQQIDEEEEIRKRRAKAKVK